MVTAFYAALLALIQVVLTLYVVKGRFQYRVSLGDGGQDDLQKRMRAHGNFVETVPIALLLMLFAEMQFMQPLATHIIGSLFVLARIGHAISILSVKPPGKLRQISMVTTLGVIIVLALWILVKISPFILTA